jgi:uncharacterized protein YqjF (DUF2071 family)
MGFIPAFSVAMDIYDVLYLSYLTPESRLHRYIPRSFTPSIVRDEMVFLSIVCFHSRDVRVAGLPFMKFSYDQINIRTYVKDPYSGKNGVLFLHSGIVSPFVALSTNMLGFPWKNIMFQIHATKNGNCYTEYRATGAWNGSINISVREDATKNCNNTLPENLAETIRHITTPETGFYKMREGALRFEVKHTKIKPHIGSISHIDFPFLESTNLLTQQEMSKPDSVLIAEKATFTAFMPPQRIKHNANSKHQILNKF